MAQLNLENWEKEFDRRVNPYNSHFTKEECLLEECLLNKEWYPEFLDFALDKEKVKGFIRQLVRQIAKEARMKEMEEVKKLGEELKALHKELVWKKKKTKNY